MNSLMPLTSAWTRRSRDRQLAPGEVGLALDALVAAVALGDLEQPLGGVGAAVEDHVLDALAQLRLDLVVAARAGRR